MLVNTKTQVFNIQDELQRQRQAIRSEGDKLRHDIGQCATAAADALLIYGPYMGRLCAAIQTAHKRKAFSVMPLGPIGRYVQLEEARWALPIENILGGHVHSFIVNDANDRRTLSELIRRQFPEHSRHSIICMRFVDKVYDVQKGAVRPAPGTRRAMDVMRVSNAVVMNCLIDQCKVDSILLTDQEQVAIRLTSDEENVPENLLRIVLLDPFSVFYPEPNYRSYSIEQKHARFLQVDMAQRRQHLEAELQRAIERQTDIDAKLLEHTKRLEEIAQTLAEKNGQRRQLEEAHRRHREKITELEMIEYPADNETEFLVRYRLLLLFS